MHILIATRNRHKIEEIKAILGPRHRFSTIADFDGAPTAIEDAPSFEGNATKKAVMLAEWLAARETDVDYVLADDSGLEVDALGGAPGVHSARFAALESANARNSPDAENNAKLIRLLRGVPEEKRTARFRCVIAFTPVPRIEKGASPVCDASEAELGTRLFSGACEGRVRDVESGQKGFGYDPLFVPNGYTQSFAELGEEVKNRISHRSQALEKLSRTM